MEKNKYKSGLYHIRTEVQSNGCFKIYNQRVVVFTKSIKGSGIIKNSQGAPIPLAKVVLLYLNPADSTLTPLDTLISNGSGEYKFDVKKDSIVIKALSPNTNEYCSILPRNMLLIRMGGLATKGVLRGFIIYQPLAH